MYYRDAFGAIITYDITIKETFVKVIDFMKFYIKIGLKMTLRIERIF